MPGMQEMTPAMQKSMDPNVWSNMMAMMMNPEKAMSMESCAQCHDAETVARYAKDFGPMMEAMKPMMSMMNPHQMSSMMNPNAYMGMMGPTDESWYVYEYDGSDDGHDEPHDGHDEPHDGNGWKHDEPNGHDGTNDESCDVHEHDVPHDGHDGTNDGRHGRNGWHANDGWPWHQSNGSNAWWSNDGSQAVRAVVWLNGRK